MPLPGTDVAYPGGALGLKYREYLQLDALDPDDWTRSQKLVIEHASSHSSRLMLHREYTLNGAYRKIIHLPKDMSWSVLRYTDPDVQLSQSDEDKLLGIDQAAPEKDGEFMALQVQFTLGIAAYATMALREITKTDTSTQHQIDLTAVAPDQKGRAVPSIPAEEEAVPTSDSMDVS